jgi:hypothetical protein
MLRNPMEKLSSNELPVFLLSTAENARHKHQPGTKHERALDHCQKVSQFEDLNNTMRTT